MQFRGNSFSWWLLKLLEAVPEEESQGLLSSMFLKIDIKNFFRLRHSCRIRTENSHVCFRRIPKRVTRPVLTLVHDQKQDRCGSPRSLLRRRCSPCLFHSLVQILSAPLLGPSLVQAHTWPLILMPPSFLSIWNSSLSLCLSWLATFFEDISPVPLENVPLFGFV